MDLKEQNGTAGDGGCLPYRNCTGIEHRTLRNFRGPYVPKFVWRVFRLLPKLYTVRLLIQDMLLQVRSRNIWSILLLSASILTSVCAQIANSNKVAFHEPKGAHPLSEPPSPLKQINAEISGSLSGQPPNVTIQFVLTLENPGREDVKIANPLDSLVLLFTTIENKLITVPERKFKAVHITGGKENISFPAPIEFRQTVQGTSVRYQKEDMVTIRPREKVQIVFDTQPVVMQNINAAIQSEGSARSFKAKAHLGLVKIPAEGGGRAVESDWLFFSL